MTARTSQCHECASVFEIAATGRAPNLCPDCKKSNDSATSRSSSNGNGAAAPAKSRRRAKPPARVARKKKAPASSEVRGAIDFLEKKLEALDEERSTIEDAIAALTPLLVVSNGRRGAP